MLNELVPDGSVFGEIFLGTKNQSCHFASGERHADAFGCVQESNGPRVFSEGDQDDIPFIPLAVVHTVHQ